MLMNELLGARIKKLREEKGFTQEQIAEKMNCTRQKYARMEKGLIDITYSNIIAISNIINVEVEEITSSINNSIIEDPMFRVMKEQGVDEDMVFLNTMLNTLPYFLELIILPGPITLSWLAGITIPNLGDRGTSG